MTKWTRIGIAAGLAALCAIGLLFWRRQPQVPKAPVPAAVPVDVSSQPLVLQGRSYCAVTLAVPAGMPGIVEEIYARMGEQVKKDDPLFKLKLSDADAAAVATRLNRGTQIQNMETNVRQLELRITQLQRDIAEMKQLSSHGMASRNSLTELEDNLRLATSQLDVARLALADTRTAAANEVALQSKNLGQQLHIGAQPKYVIVRAPIAGHIISIEGSVQPGATMAGNLCAIGVMDPMIIRGQVHESELARLQSASNATIVSDAGRGEHFEATLSRLSWTALDPGLSAPAYYIFEFTVANPDLKIRDGFKVQVTVQPRQGKQ